LPARVNGHVAQKSAPSVLPHFLRYCSIMEPEDRETRSRDERQEPQPECDPELEREFRELAQWLIDVYLSTLQQERNASGNPRVDSCPPSRTM
jgi:hypothetical protein